ncbi:hypothetical protein BDP27DRAFT_1337859, partial [Rhodocollybia butyracea]
MQSNLDLNTQRLTNKVCETVFIDVQQAKAHPGIVEYFRGIEVGLASGETPSTRLNGKTLFSQVWTVESQGVQVHVNSTMVYDKYVNETQRSRLSRIVTVINKHARSLIKGASLGASGAVDTSSVHDETAAYSLQMHNFSVSPSPSSGSTDVQGNLSPARYDVAWPSSPGGYPVAWPSSPSGYPVASSSSSQSHALLTRIPAARHFQTPPPLTPPLSPQAQEQSCTRSIRALLTTLFPIWIVPLCTRTWVLAKWYKVAPAMLCSRITFRSLSQTRVIGNQRPRIPTTETEMPRIMTSLTRPRWNIGLVQCTAPILPTYFRSQAQAVVKEDMVNWTGGTLGSN